MNFIKSTRIAGAIAALSLATLAQASFVNADFETDLSGWTERNPALPTGEIVADPLNSGRGNVLNFQRIGSTGTLFSVDAATSPSGMFTLSFDYLGLQGQGGGTAGDLGGYIGVVPFQGHWDTTWIGGTGLQFTPLDLIDDGQWHSYSYSFTTYRTSLSVVAQDWDNSGPLSQAPRDAFFDNISLRATSVPEPTSLALVGLALVAMGASAKRASNKRA